MAVKVPDGWYDISVPLKQGMNYFPTDPAPPKIYRFHDVELGARVYVFWGGREGVESDATKNPLDSARRMRHALNFLCEYVIDQGYDLRFALEAKPKPRKHRQARPNAAGSRSLKPRAGPRNTMRRSWGASRATKTGQSTARTST